MAGGGKGKGPTYTPDRPLSKAYLREFGGWSTAYPPGTSDPTTLRILENLQITREGAARVRPALRSVLTENVWLDSNYSSTMVGGFEHFFLNDGRKALLFAARQPGGEVAFKAAVYNAATKRFDVKNLTDAGLAFNIPQGEAVLNFTSATTFVRYLQIDNKIFALSDGGEDLRLFDVGSSKTARKVTPITRPNFDSADALTVVHPDAAWINSSQTTIPTAETPITTTLISSTAASNTYSYAFFYTFENQIGESAPSALTVIKAARGWSQWRFLQPNADGSPSATPVTDPAKAMDQLVAIMPSGAGSVYLSAIAQGAIRWNLYMATWSDQDSVPPEAVNVATVDLVSGTVVPATRSWAQATVAISLGSSSAPLPNAKNRENYSDPAQAGQGLVAGDRLILVNDKENGARIRWSSNLPGEYTNFTPTKGGGVKTLTTGNLQIPVAVKLWQNPQSVDTITILCAGVDGYSTAYYMAPAAVSGQSAATSIMGFEETTATPGTVSPYGCEVFNNTLIHPLDMELMKSSASNYNINHSSLTDDIANKWRALLNKRKIVSAQHDNRIYYIVHNPEGEALATNCNGNEVWVYDGAKDQGQWSRWLVQGISLTKLEIDGRLYMSICRPEGIFVFDDQKMTDDVSASGGTLQRTIPWKMETNTQGANRAHDAWAHLKQIGLVVGNYRGAIEYGIIGIDSNGKKVEIRKTANFNATDDLASRPLPFDIEDFLSIGRNLKEWRFFANSVVKAGVTQLSYGQINLIQYRYAPVTVNVGYEYGSVETFEYERSSGLHESYTDNGVPQPFIDTERP